MKKLFLIAGISGFMSIALHAQVMPERKNDGPNKERRTMARGDMYQDLNLTADQKAKLKALNEESRPKMEAIRNDNNLSKEQKKARFEELMQSQKVKRDAIFTPEQKAKLDAKMDQIKKDGKQKGDWKKGDKKGSRDFEGKTEGLRKKGSSDSNGLSRNVNNRRGWSKELNLTSDQQKKMKVLNEEHRSKMLEIRDNASLTKEQKRTAQQDLMKKMQLERKNILTAEQLQKWEMHQKQTRMMRPHNKRSISNI